MRAEKANKGLEKQSVRSERHGLKACLRGEKAMGQGRGQNTRRVEKACSRVEKKSVGSGRQGFKACLRV